MRHPTPALEPEEPSTLYLLNHRPRPSSNNHLPTSQMEDSQHRPLKCSAFHHVPQPSRGSPRRRLGFVLPASPPGLSGYTNAESHPFVGVRIATKSQKVDTPAIHSGIAASSFKLGTVRHPYWELSNVSPER